jgi:hypothetical protein
MHMLATAEREDVNMVVRNVSSDKKVSTDDCSYSSGDLHPQQANANPLQFKPVSSLHEVLSVVSSGTDGARRSIPSSPSSSVSPLLLQSGVDAHGWPADPATSSVTSPSLGLPAVQGALSASTGRRIDANDSNGRPARRLRVEVAAHARREAQLRKPRTAPRWCHICARECTAKPHLICDGVVDQLHRCSRFVCKTCFDRFGWDWVSANDDEQWRCMHCKGACPPVAQCNVKGGLPSAKESHDILGHDPRAAQTKRRYRSDLAKLSFIPVD